MQPFLTHEFGVVAGGADGTGSRPFQFEKEKCLVAHPASAPDHSFDCCIDRLDNAEAYGVIAVRSDTVEVPNQKVAELLHLGQPLPPQCLQPAKEKSGNTFSGPVR